MVATEKSKIGYAEYLFSPEIIPGRTWLTVTDWIVQRWANHFGPAIATGVRKRQTRPHTAWHQDEIHLKVDGRLVYIRDGATMPC